MQGGIVAVRLLLISSRLDAHLQMIYKNFRQHASMHMLSDFFFILGADWNQFNQACLLRSRGNMQRRALLSFPGWIIFVVVFIVIVFFLLLLMQLSLFLLLLLLLCCCCCCCCCCCQSSHCDNQQETARIKFCQWLVVVGSFLRAMSYNMSNNMHTEDKGRLCC